MYRNNKTGGFKSPMINHESSSSREDEGTGGSTRSLTANKVRSTKRILNLLKKSTEDLEEEKPRNNETIETSKIEVESPKENLPPVATNEDKIVFNVVIGKKSTRKHKVWDDDGILEVNGSSAVLKDTEGKIIGRTKVNLESLEEGFRLSIGNKEIEIIDRISCVECPPKKEIATTLQEPPKKKFKSSTAPFVPLSSLKKGLKLAYEPLVMPTSNSTEDWLKEDITKEEEVLVDPCLASILRPHQRYGIVFLYECLMGKRTPNHFGAILADEMGLGKTLQCIAIVWTLLKKGPHGRPEAKRVLIVAPSSLCGNWNKEFVRWLGYHRICPYVVDAKNKPKDFKKRSGNCVMIVSYDMLVRYQEEVEELNFDLMICDEGHRLKNNDIKAAKFLRNMECKRRILLSGTPIQNDLQEFFSLSDFVNPGILGSSSEFKNYYEGPIVASQCPDAIPDVVELGRERAAELHERTTSFILRRTQETINNYLPSKHEIVVFCSLSEDQEKLYSLVTDAWFKKNVIPGSGTPHLTMITALKKICNHPDLFLNDKNDILSKDLMALYRTSKLKRTRNSGQEYCGKVTIVRALMRNLKKTDEKLVLISYYTQTLDLLETVCTNEGLKFLRLDGSTATATRSKVVEQFNSRSNDTKIFLLSAKAGGVGLNLPGASRLILFDSDWNPASDAQAMARIWRDGQKKDVYIYRLLTTGTIEEKIFQRQISKAGLSETVVDLNYAASLKFTSLELKNLFTLTKDTVCLTHDLMKCTCNRRKQEKMSENLHYKEEREYQLTVDDKPRQKLTINQLLEWEHYERPVPSNVMEKIMLVQVSEWTTFLFKNSTVR